MNNQTCCFTGHRNLPKVKIGQIKKLLENEVINLINQGVVEFYNGGALGFDMLAAETVIRLKCQFPHIFLIMALPCQNQDELWNFIDKRRYRKILKEANDIICLSEKYYDGCMLDRNKFMIDHSGYCIAYLTQPRGGTLHTVNYARKKGVEVINLAERL